jgi:hypothetical protein
MLGMQRISRWQFYRSAPLREPFSPLPFSFVLLILQSEIHNPQSIFPMPDACLPCVALMAKKGCLTPIFKRNLELF